jgi:hypothetical protein
MGIADEGVRLTLRLPEALRDQLLRRARLNTRSMNSEIIATLEGALGAGYAGTPGGLRSTLDEATSSDSSQNELVALCSRLSQEQLRHLLALLRSLAR